MAAQNNPAHIRKKIHISGDGEYKEEFISRRAIQSKELIILDPIFTRKDYFKALFFPDIFDIGLIIASVITHIILHNFVGIGLFDASAFVFIGIYGIFYYTSRFAYFSVSDLLNRIQKTQNPNRLVRDLDFDFSFWGLLFNLLLIAIGSYLTGL